MMYTVINESYNKNVNNICLLLTACSQKPWTKHMQMPARQAGRHADTVNAQTGKVNNRNRRAGRQAGRQADRVNAQTDKVTNKNRQADMHTVASTEQEAYRSMHLLIEPW